MAEHRPDGVGDARPGYRLVGTDTVLRFDRGTLLLEGVEAPPGAVADWFRFDPRVDAWRAPAYCYDRIIGVLRGGLASNRAPRYRRLDLTVELDLAPFAHQREALAGWRDNRGRGLVVLPTGAGKTLVGLLAMAWAGRDSLVLVPTLDLLHQWYALLRAAFPGRELGLLGGGYRELLPLTVATYDSASRLCEQLGNRYGLLVFDEVHHLPSEFYRVIAELSLAPYRLGLSATPERSDGRHRDLDELVGPVVYRREPAELAGEVLAPFQIRSIPVSLSAAERVAYQAALDTRDAFLRAQRIGLGSIQGWNRFVMASARSAEGRRAMQAHREARRIAHATPAKLRALAAILASHPHEKLIVFTEDNATAYEISRQFLLPCMTHQTRIKERQAILEGFRDGIYRALVTSRVLNEGVDMPDAAVGVILSGSGSSREFIQRLGRLLRRREGKRALLYEVVARDTREEGVMARRREGLGPDKPGTLSLFDDDGESQG